eukprot:g4987.t1
MERHLPDGTLQDAKFKRWEKELETAGLRNSEEKDKMKLLRKKRPKVVAEQRAAMMDKLKKEMQADIDLGKKIVAKASPAQIGGGSPQMGVGAKLVVTGPENAGKKTIVGRFRLGDGRGVKFRQKWVLHPSNEQLSVKPASSSRLFHFDLTRKTWAKYAAEMRKYYGEAEGVVFVVDSSDRESLLDARDLLHRMLKDPMLHDSVILVLANKSDAEGALNVGSVTRLLELEQFNQLIWRVVGTSGLSEQGLYEAMDWLSRTLVKKQELAGASPGLVAGSEGG